MYDLPEGLRKVYYHINDGAEKLRGVGLPAGAVLIDAFGALPDGDGVVAVTLTNANGMRVRLLSYGASIQAVEVPDRHGRRGDVALGHSALSEYLDQPQYLGSTVGRVANRIAGGQFVLDGRRHAVPVNNGPNALHGGTDGFDKRNWRVLQARDTPHPAVMFQLDSVDGDQGFPGHLIVSAEYELDDANALHITYMATTDRPTVVNLSNHAYWNLAGEGSPEGAMGHVLRIPAGHYLPTDAGAIPTGEIAEVEGTPFDFRAPTPIGARVRDATHPQIRIGRGYDHNWVVADGVAALPRLLAAVWDPSSGRMMEVHSNQPGLQFYSGNFLDGSTIGKSGRAYRMGDAIALEPQMPPDSVNQPELGSVRLDPGQTYCNRITFRFSVSEGMD